jgi:rSAM/selenodomain-associated transferase 1
MAKAPIPGTVKTRLRLDPDAAARLQTALIRDTVEKALTLGPTTVAGAPKDSLDLIESLLPQGVPLIPQPEGDLGEKMLSAAGALFAGSTQPVVILGTDAPTLLPQVIRDAAEALTTHDVSIIPSVDGGYVLLGLGGPYEAVFSGVVWSTGEVHGQTVERAVGAGLSVYEGEAWYDVDEPEDLARLADELSAHPDVAPRTAEVLGTLRGFEAGS